MAIEGSHEKRRNIGLRVGVLARLLRNNFDREVASLGVTRSQWAMIAVVATHPGATQRVIAEKLDMSEASAGRLVDRLCADGLLERREREDDRRARAVYVTDKANPLLDKLAEIAGRSEERMFAGFSEKQIDQLDRLLEQLYENVSRS